MRCYFTKGRTAYVRESDLLDDRGNRIRSEFTIPSEWRIFGVPIRYQGRDGFMGRTRFWEREFGPPQPMKLFYTIQALEGLSFRA